MMNMGNIKMQDSFSHIGNVSVKNKKAEKKSFQEQLKEFRHDIRTDSMKSKNKQKKTEEKTQKPQSFEPNQKLFSKWDSSLSIDENLKVLNRNLSQVDISDISVTEAMGHFASQGAIYGDYIKKNGAAEQKEKFEKIMADHIERFAKDFSDKVGGFFEKNGMTGEKERIYQSIQKQIQNLTGDYGQFLSANQNLFQDFAQESDENNNTCFAFELQRLYAESGNGYSSGGACYGYDQLAELENLASAAETLFAPKRNGIASEEELGVKFGEMKVQSLSILEKSKAGLKFKEAFGQAVDHYIESSLDKVDYALLKQGTGAGSPSPLDKSAVHLVIEAMTDSYAYWGSVSKAVSSGKEFGMYIYFMKQDSSQSAGRYGNSAFFDDFLAETIQRFDGDLSKVKRAASVNLMDYQQRLHLKNRQRGLNTSV
ncbi:MAG: hypothetical protein HFG18_04675 [Oscillospiraceae bacterium]|nr:hypothetical protein [Oscillospiraceae bacterium]